MEPLVLRCRTLAPYVPLRATSSESVPSVDIAYIVQRSVTKTEFHNYLLLSPYASCMASNERYNKQINRK